MNFRFIINKIEGNKVICEKEDGTFFDKELYELPFGIKSGDSLIQMGNIICFSKE